MSVCPLCFQSKHWQKLILNGMNFQRFWAMSIMRIIHMKKTKLCAVFVLSHAYKDYVIHLKQATKYNKAVYTRLNETVIMIKMFHREAIHCLYNEMCCAIYYHFYILKDGKNIHGEVLLYVKLQVLPRCQMYKVANDMSPEIMKRFLTFTEKQAKAVKYFQTTNS